MYEVIARYYDLFMSDDEWVKFAVRAVKGRLRGADVGCGSGTVAAALAPEHDVVAVDSSDEMLRAANDKFMRMGLKIPTVKQNITSLKLPRPVDFITAMCDVVNYLKEPKRFFSAAYDNLESGGILVFDISSADKLREDLGNNVFSETKDDVTYIWENSLGRNCVDMTLTFFIPEGGLYKKEVDVQRQYIHEESAISAALREVGFSVEVSHGKGRIYFTAQKEPKGE